MSKYVIDRDANAFAFRVGQLCDRWLCNTAAAMAKPDSNGRVIVTIDLVREALANADQRDLLAFLRERALEDRSLQRDDPASRADEQAA